MEYNHEIIQEAIQFVSEFYGQSANNVVDYFWDEVESYCFIMENYDE